MALCRWASRSITWVRSRAPCAMPAPCSTSSPATIRATKRLPIARLRTTCRISSLPLAACASACPENFYFERLDAGRGCRRARRFRTRRGSRGAKIVPLRMPDIAAINTVARLILLAEASAVLEPHLEQRDQFGADVLALLDQGRLVPATDYINAQRLRRRMQREFAALWSRVDCLFTPTTPITAPRIGETTVTVGGESRGRAPGDHPPGARHQPVGPAGAFDSLRRGPPRPAHRPADRRPSLRAKPSSCAWRRRWSRRRYLYPVFDRS